MNNILLTTRGDVKKRIGKDQLNRVKKFYLSSLTRLFMLKRYIGEIPENLNYILSFYLRIINEKTDTPFISEDLKTQEEIKELIENTQLLEEADISDEYKTIINSIKQNDFLSTILQQ